MSKPADYCDLGVNWQSGCLPGLPCYAKCWARAMASRFAGCYGYDAMNPFKPTWHEDIFRRPLPKKGKVIALNFMGDIGHIAPKHLWATWLRCRENPQHTFLVLSKWLGKLAAAQAEVDERVAIPDNVWLGTSAEGQGAADLRIPALLRILAARYWLSLEPLLARVMIPRFTLGPAAVCHCRRSAAKGMEYGSREPDFAAHPDCPECGRPRPVHPGIGFVVVGCESGPGARWGASTCAANDPICEGRERPSTCPRCPHGGWAVTDWTRSLVAQCRAAAVPVWVKQLPVFKGGKWRVSSDMADFPPDLRVQQTPFGKEKS